MLVKIVVYQMVPIKYFEITEKKANKQKQCILPNFCLVCIAQKALHSQQQKKKKVGPNTQISNATTKEKEKIYIHIYCIL